MYSHLVVPKCNVGRLRKTSIDSTIVVLICILSQFFVLRIILVQSQFGPACHYYGTKINLTA